MALTKIDDRGLKTPIDLLDNEKIRFGTGNDLEIYHDGNNSYILNSTGELQLRDQSRIKLRTDQFVINNFANDESIIYAAANGAVELYYDGVKKFETKSTGVGITGELHIPDGEWMRFGTDQLQIRSNANNAYIVEGASGKLQIQASNFELSNAAANKTYLYATDGGSIDLYYDNSKKFETTAAGVRIYNTAAADAELRITASEGRPSVIIMDADDADDNADIWRLKASDDGSYYLQNYASGSYETNIKANGNGNVELYWDNSKKLATTSGGVHIYNALSTSGAISIGNGANLTVEDNGKAVFGFGSDLQIYANGSASYIAHNGDGDLFISTGASGENLYVSSAEHLILRTAASENAVYCSKNAHVSLYYDSSQKFYTQSYGAVIDGTLKPAANNTHDLGDNSYKFSTVWAKNTAKAWINVDGDASTASIRASHNVSSLTDDAYERHTVNFSTNMGSASNYCFVSGARAGDSGGGGRVVVGYDTPTASAFKYQMRNLGNSNEHVDAACLAFFST